MSDEKLESLSTVTLKNGSSGKKANSLKSIGNSESTISSQPSNQLSAGLLGWYSVCSSKTLKSGELSFITMFNEPLVLYRDNDSRVRCIKDLCPHRGASFQGGTIDSGEIICPYHGGRFSAEGTCTNLDRITCQHIVDSNYNNYAKKIHLYQYPCIENNGYVYIYYTGEAKTDLKEFEFKRSLKDSLPEAYGFETSEYAFEEVFVDFKCDWARIIENHLDILHIFWIHGNTIPDKDVNRNAITSFDQEITRDSRHIESKYHHKKNGNGEGEFISIKFVPPGRIMIYKGTPKTARYIQVLDHIPLGSNRARVIVRHYRKFMKNKVLTDLILFKHLQQRIFYKVFSEDYLVLKTQTFNEQMGYIKKDNVKLLGEDKMVQYYWDWHQNALNKDKPWQIHATNSNTNTVHLDMPMPYPPENPKLAIENQRAIVIKLLIRALVPIGLLLLII